MAATSSGEVIDSSERGVSGRHSARAPLRVLAGPATDDQFNTVQTAIFPIACWRAEDVNFEFDSSFVQPEARPQIARLKALVDQHPQSPISLFGHADPVGNDDYNKALSGRRVIAVFAMLRRKVEMWEELFTTDHWGNRALNAMLQAVTTPPTPVSEDILRFEENDAPDDPAAVPLPPESSSLSPASDANAAASARDESPPTPALVKQFQESHGLGPDGVVGPITRKELIRAYMDFLCVGLDDQPFTLSPDQFLGRGADAGGKADYQGCGEFNPVLMFSQAEQQAFERDTNKAPRNRENAPNRRVLALLFRPGVKVSPSQWPCPRAKEGTAACHRRFWSDASKRRTFQADRRKFEETHDTFACRFYHRLNVGSPCEKVIPGPPGVCYVFLRLFEDGFERSLGGRPYELRGLQRPTKIRGITDGDGVLRHEQLPDDHYELECLGKTESVEPFYMSDMKPDDEPWFLRMRGLDASGAPS